MTGVTLREQVPAREAGANHAERSGRLGLAALTAYGAGQMVQDTIQYALNTLLLFYLTIVCGLSGSAAGLALGVALVVDAFVDPLVGSLSDNSRSRHGRRHPWMAPSAVPIALAFVMLFSVPPGLSGAALFAWALFALLAVRIGLSGFTVPYIALGAELSDDYAERSIIVASRVMFTVAATAVGAFLAFGVFMKGVGGQTHRDAYPPFAISCGLVVFVAAALSTLGTLRSRGRLHAAPPAKGAAIGRLAAEVAEVFRNPSFRVLFLACLILFVGLGAAAALTLHANTYFWQLPRPRHPDHHPDLHRRHPRRGVRRRGRRPAPGEAHHRPVGHQPHRPLSAAAGGPEGRRRHPAGRLCADPDALALPGGHRG